MNVPLAEPTVKWTSIPVQRRYVVPSRRGELRQSHLLLKDTRRKKWNKRLVSPHRYAYVIPTVGSESWERDLCSDIHRRHREGRNVFVHLYATPGSREEYYGEWVISDLKK